MPSIWIVGLCTLACALWPTAHAYIPAMPSNTTTLPLEQTTPSKLNLNWFKGTTSEDVSYQLAGWNSDGVNQVRVLRILESQIQLTYTSLGRARALFGAQVGQRYQ